MEKDLNVAREAAASEIEAPNMAEVIRNFKTVSLGKYGDVTLSRPSFYIQEEGDKMVSAYRRKLLLDREVVLPTESELKEIWADRGDWTPELEKEMETSRKIIIDIIHEKKEERGSHFFGEWIDECDYEMLEFRNQVDAASEDEDLLPQAMAKYFIARECRLGKLQERLLELRKTKMDLFSGTIESFVNFERQVYYCVKCYTKDGKQIWKNIQELKDEDMDVFNIAVTEGLRFWAGMDVEELESFFVALQGE